MNQNPASHSNGPEPRPQDPQAPKLLDRLRLVMQQERFDTATIKRFVEWNKRFIIYHRLRHPQSLTDEEIEAFVKQGSLRDADRQEAARAVRLMYRKVLGRELPPVRSAASARGASVSPTANTAATAQGEPRLLERVRQVLRARGYAWRTEESYVSWIIRYVLFHHQRHPLELGAGHIEAFLTDLVVKGQVSASTQNQALHALLFLYQQVLEIELPVIRAVQSRNRTDRIRIFSRWRKAGMTPSGKGRPSSSTQAEGRA